MEMPKTALIILNRNGYADTVECLESLNADRRSPFKICLVDNGSEKSEADRLSKRYPDIHLIRLSENKGFSGGCNAGINWAFHNGFDYIIVLNNDTVAAPEWPDCLMRGLFDSGADFASSMILDFQTRKIIDSAGDALLPDGSGLSLFRGAPADSIKQTRNIFSACGAGSVFSRTCLEKIKLPGSRYFSEKHFAYYEDIDLALRLNTAGFKGVVVPRAKIYHKGGKTHGRFSPFQVFHTEKNRMLNMLLNYPFLYIPVGEAFYLLKGLFILFFSLAGYRGKGKTYGDLHGFSKMFRIFFKARIWVLFSLPDILKERQFRKKKGWISWKVIGFFHWKLFAAIK